MKLTKQNAKQKGERIKVRNKTILIPSLKLISKKNIKIQRRSTKIILPPIPARSAVDHIEGIRYQNPDCGGKLFSIEKISDAAALKDTKTPLCGKCGKPLEIRRFTAP